MVHFYLSWRSHQLSVQQVHQEFKPIAGQRWDSAQLHKWAGSYIQYSPNYNISIFQNSIDLNLLTGFAQLHRLPLPSLADVDSNPLPRHHLSRLRHQRWWQCGGKGNQQHYSWNGYWTSPTNKWCDINRKVLRCWIELRKIPPGVCLRACKNIQCEDWSRGADEKCRELRIGEVSDLIW